MLHLYRSYRSSFSCASLCIARILRIDTSDNCHMIPLSDFQNNFNCTFGRRAQIILRNLANHIVTQTIKTIFFTSEIHKHLEK